MYGKILLRAKSTSVTEYRAVPHESIYTENHMAKVNMRETEYYMSGEHKKNILKARTQAVIVQNTKLQDRVNTYNQNPNKCQQCDKPISYQTKKNKFCSSSCAATFNNLKRLPRTDESKAKTSITLKGKARFPKGSISLTKTICKIYYKTCTVCDKIFVLPKSRVRKTCSRECQTHASVGNRTYTNGRRLNIYYFNKHEQREVLLESSWEHEIAKWLDNSNIVWIRPKPIKWFDNDTNKTRLYYPDFYLPEKHLYLDPKNQTALALSKNKMDAVEKLIPLIYGSIEHIKSMVGMERF